MSNEHTSYLRLDDPATRQSLEQMQHDMDELQKPACEREMSDLLRAIRGEPTMTIHERKKR